MSIFIPKFEQMEIQHFLTEEQDLKTIEKLVPKINDLLLETEQIQYIAIQKKPVANLLPTTIVATNKRLFYCEPANLGLTTDFSHLFWEDIKSASFKEELFGAKFICVPNEGENISTEYIPKAQARKLAQVAAAQLQSVKTQPTAPLVQIQTEAVQVEPIAATVTPETTPSPAPVETTPAVDEVTQRLQKLKSLFEKQLISNEEYEQKKAQILNEL